MVRPVVLVPGFAGSKLVKKGNMSSRNRVFNFDVLDKKWKKDFHYTFDKVNGLKISDNLEPYKFGETDGIVNLCDDCMRVDKLLSKVTKTEHLNDKFGYKYFSDVTRHLEDAHGYLNGTNMLGAPYDFRTVMLDNKYMLDLKQLIESGVEKANGAPAVIIAHSIGCLLVSLMLLTHTSEEWRRQHVYRFLSICGPFGGCSLAAGALVLGHPLFSKISKDYDHVLQCCSGLALSLPNFLSYGTEKQPVFVDKRSHKMYNIFVMRQLLSECMNHLLYNHIDPQIHLLKENVGVDTRIIYTTSKHTPISYVIRSNDRVETINAPGDGVVPVSSLLLHWKLRYSNYIFYDLPDTDHSKILSNHRFLKLIDRLII